VSVRTRYLLIAAGVGVAAAIGIVSTLSRHTDSANLRSLAQAVGPTRATKGRISGFPYQPMAAHVRGGSKNVAEDWKLYAAASAIKQAADRTPNVQTLHALGVAYLVSGSAAEGVNTMLHALALETGEEDDPKVAIAKSEDASLLTDLSIALQERAVLRNQSEDCLLSVTAAERAYRLDPHSAEAAWNRAVAIERLHLRSSAVEAWRNYVAIEHDRKWLNEAGNYLRTLDILTDADRWTQALALFARTAAPRDAAVLARFPSRAFDYCESLLIDSADAATRQDRERAERAAKAARVLAAAITRKTGDGMVEETASTLVDGADSRLADALSQYGRAKNIRTSRSITESIGALRASQQALENLNVPLALRIAVSVASAQYESHDQAGALRTLSAIPEAALRRYPVELAHAARVRGLANASLGYADAARQAYFYARNIYERVGDLANVGNIDLLLADNAQYTGDWTSTWRYYESSLENTVAHGDRGKQLLLYIVMARSASRAGYFSVSLLLRNQAVGILERDNKPAYLCQLLITRGETEHRLGLNADADADAARAAAAYERVADPAVKKRLIADLSMLIASVRPVDPATFRQIDEAIAASTDTQDHFRLARLYLLRGRQRMRTRSEAAAEADFRDGIAEFEAQRERLASDDDRITFLETARELFNELIRLFVASGRRAEAFDVAEERSARVLQDHLATISQQSVRSELRLVEGTRLLRLLPDGDAVHVWIAGNGGAVTYTVLRVPHLRHRIAAAVNELERDDGTTPTRDLDSLSRALISPFVAQLQGADRLIVIADDELAMLPFAALRDPTTGKYLVERFAIVSSPSVRAYLRGRDTTRRLTSLLFVHVPRPPQVLSTETLPPLTSDEHALFVVAAKHFAQSRFVDGPSATASLFLQRVRQADVIHFSGHAIEPIPGQVSLVLMPDADHPDGLLSAETLSSTPVPPGAVVVLAACSTNTGRISSDGVMSLARSFLLAGSSSVIATSWNVEDEASTAFFELFYAHFRKTNDVAASLRATQIEFAHSTRYRAPRYWAAFGITGGA